MKTKIIASFSIIATLIFSNYNQMKAQNMEHKITDTASKNHEKLFPNNISNLETTDPEFIAFYTNFVFDDVADHGQLDAKTKTMMILASTIASQALSEYKIMMNAALYVGVTPVEIKEIVYQSVPYVGISKVIDFIHITNKVLTDKGIKLPLEGQSTTTRETRFDEGLAVQKEIFGEETISNMYKSSPENQMHIQKYLSANCFGDYYTRKGLDVKTRELLTFSMLLSLGGCESQLKGHIQGNVNVGNHKQILLSVVTQLLPYVGYPRTLNAINCINEIIPE